MYDFDPYRLYIRLVPWFLRAPKFLGILFVTSKALEFLQGLLLAFTTQVSYDMLFNAQVIYLEYVLNDTFASTPDIYIENVFLPPFSIYNKIEAQPPIYFRNLAEGAPPVYLRNNEEAINATQYIVHVAAGLSGDVLIIAALINLYNLAGINYEILFDL